MPLHDISHVTSSPPPGFEIGYTQITAPVNVTGTTSGAATTVITANPVAFDGAPVMMTFYSPSVRADTAGLSDLLTISLFEGSTEIGQIAVIRATDLTVGNVVSICPQYRFTPTAGIHTYLIKAYVTSTTGTPQVGAGTGGTTAQVAAFVRFTKV